MRDDLGETVNKVIRLKRSTTYLEASSRNVVWARLHCVYFERLDQVNFLNLSRTSIYVIPPILGKN
ncbi:hypothetical protein EGJ52_07585 [Pseudomonas luteola]|nr:hypothetical protein EGJ52_07585 [Pseudomonas luteola]